MVSSRWLYVLNHDDPYDEANFMGVAFVVVQLRCCRQRLRNSNSKDKKGKKRGLSMHSVR
jgi:hypothetical protein